MSSVKKVYHSAITRNVHGTIKVKDKIKALSLGIIIMSSSLHASESLPGEGVTVRPMDFGNQNTQFQSEIIRIGLETLGYKVNKALEADPTIAHVSVGQEDADYMAVHWEPLHNDYFARAGGENSNTKLGTLVKDAAQGILIDKKTADAYGITSLSQLKDPKIAALFDMDEDGKADLTGCNPGWGCEEVIETHLDNLGLRDTVTHRQGVYVALMADTITRFREGKPVLYYTWTPMWVSSLLVPGKDSSWLTIPEKNQVASKDDGLGFVVNTVRIMANNHFLEQNPAAKHFFELVTIDINDINAQNALIQAGEKSSRDVTRHAKAWISNHQDLFNHWITQAKEFKPKS
ncbi:glycine betaine/L-proline ABC transporter substrate-binding protein ProX [Marinomonas sp. 15G1-11]|uniref:Glycine betaine/L-proline ABC transporter substrate-binding protein ProX n=1 Tax=Marinomonas phaeophyticola TaxID=3004091 RepID=A0ABT4JZ00_9GAMM|nr:glycine betaine/L-proline ABC transporter substrate-binding protein ProX [Marinomonas sp. 15G1-11]MCZ2723608.1 glycine betaine/L-proline ABC transporter substrate-binding protein ProX [Marinomonas sp. 15G1-11]